MIVIREGNAALTDEEKTTYTTVKSFLDLTFQMSTKRQKLETADDKVDEGTADVSEPMDTSEDVEISDVNDKKVEKNDAKEVIESEGNTKDQPSEDTSISLGQAEESIAVEKDISNTEQEMTDSDAKLKDTNEDIGSSESAKCTMKDDTATKDNDKGTVAEKTDENLDIIVTTAAADDSIDVSKSETILTSSEKKIEDSIDIAKDTQAESTNKIQTIENDEKADDNESQSQTCDKNIANKSEECLIGKKDDAKEESKIISDTSESENILAKSEQEAIKETTDVTENGEAPETAVEKTTVSVTVTETEATVTDIRKEATASTEVSGGKSSEVTAESEKVDDKVAQGMETKTTDADKRENETMQQETIKEEEPVKEENVVDTKDKNTVDSEKQKLNGTTQNGNTDVPVLDDKLHSNGLNEGSSKETTNEDAAAQNGEPESLSESSAESIKVKKVVDSAVADGAGESDVVPPVVVAATS